MPNCLRFKLGTRLGDPPTELRFSGADQMYGLRLINNNYVANGTGKAFASISALSGDQFEFLHKPLSFSLPRIWRSSGSRNWVGAGERARARAVRPCRRVAAPEPVHPNVTSSACFEKRAHRLPQTPFSYHSTPAPAAV